MATSQFRTDLYAPMVHKNIPANSTGLLHVSTDGSGGANGLAPPGINHAPCGFIAANAAAMNYKDANGNALAFTFGNQTYYPISIAELTGTNPALLVVWQEEV